MYSKAQDNPQESLIGKPEGKSRFGRPRRRWDYNSKMDLKEIEWEDLDWIPLAKDMYRWRTDVNMAMEVRVIYNAGEELHQLR